MYKIIFDNEAELLKNNTVYIILGVEFLANIATKNNTYYNKDFIFDKHSINK